MTDISRLQVQLQVTKLQNKDNPLYQLLHELIGALKDTSSEVTALSGTVNNSSNSVTNNITNNNYSMQSGISSNSSGLSATSTPSYSIVNNSPITNNNNIMQLLSSIGSGLGGLHATFIPMFSPVIPSSSSGVTGTGTTGKLPKWASSTSLIDSIISEAAGVITIPGQLILSNLANGSNGLFLVGATTNGPAIDFRNATTGLLGQLWIQDNKTWSFYSGAIVGMSMTSNLLTLGGALKVGTSSNAGAGVIRLTGGTILDIDIGSSGMRIFDSTDTSLLLNLSTAGLLTVPAMNANGSIQNTYKILLSGQEFYGPASTDTAGLALLLGVNRTGNRQLWIADSAALTQNSTNGVLRIFPSTTGATISSLKTDGTTLAPLLIEATITSIIKGASGASASGNAVLALHNSTQNILSVLAPAADSSGILFGDPINTNLGGMVYKNSSNATPNRLEIRTNGIVKFGINTDGDWLKGSSLVIMDSVGTPTIASGFGSAPAPSIVGNDYAFILTIGGGATSGGVINFGHSFTNPPICVTSGNAGALSDITLSTTTTALSIAYASGSLSGLKIHVLSRGY